jgi:geranylgeranyl diphosphate synthase type II
MRLESDRTAIENRLGELMPPGSEPPVSLHEAMRHSTLAGGKRIRGILCLGSHRIFRDPRPSAALDAACAIEMLHAYTLIHDDLPALDDDDVRRGKPSCHVRFGEAVAILAGDALQALAFEVLSQCDAPGGLALKAVKMLSRSAGSRYLIGGQVADIEGEGQEATEDAVTFIHSRKTARLIGASLGIGATLAGADEADCERIVEAGSKVGFAFQIIDDILDIEGSERLVGKGLRKDSKKGKMTHPAYFGVERSREIAGELVNEATAQIQELGDRGYLTGIFEMILHRAS